MLHCNSNRHYHNEQVLSLQKKLLYLTEISEYTSAGFSPATKFTAAASNWQKHSHQKKESINVVTHQKNKKN